MKRLLAYSYFCPTASERRGGVQQVVPALLAGLEETGRWAVTVAHPGLCSGPASHVAISEVGSAAQGDQVEPKGLVDCALRLRALSTSVDVILSIDRLHPPICDRPTVLMCNTLGYQTEAAAACLPTWQSIVVPTRHFARQVRTVNPAVPVEVVPYGLSQASFAKAAAMAAPDWTSARLRVQLPHRPDRRKGHVAAIEGLAPTDGLAIDLEIAWLNEPRYAGYRAELEDLATSRGVAAQVHFRNWVDGEARWEALESAHAVMQLGSFEETFGLAAIEAVLSGRVAITHHQPAIREVVGTTDLLIELDDPSRWHEALLASAASLAGGSSSVSTGERLTGLTIDRMVGRYDEVLGRVCCGWG